MIIPVLDLKNGEAVSGKSGNRDNYKPLKTVFHHTSSPHKIAQALKKIGISRIYIADLDAIEKSGSNLNLIKDINKHVSVMLDCGVSNIDDVKKALEAADKVIVATETLQNIEQLYHIFKSFKKEKLIISIDIKDGKLYSKNLKLSLEELIPIIKKLNPEEVILLDISRVGLEKGINIELLNKVKGTGKSLIIGGGLRNKDIIKLQKEGINKFLVGSALHKGKIMLNQFKG